MPGPGPYGNKKPAAQDQKKKLVMKKVQMSRLTSPGNALIKKLKKAKLAG